MRPDDRGKDVPKRGAKRNHRPGGGGGGGGQGQEVAVGVSPVYKKRAGLRFSKTQTGRLRDGYRNSAYTG